jgi:PBP4 family serine-type D-alanyl-D-alanine carboxypeptidase
MISRRRSPRALVTVAAAALALVSACTTADSSDSPSTAGPPRSGDLPATVTAVLDQPQYANASWSLLVTDLDSGQTLYAMDPDQLAYTGSTRKLFSVGLMLDELGAGHRTTTSVYRDGSVDPTGTLHGNLVFVGAGDLTLGGRRTADGALAFTDFDHNDANNLGAAILTPQDPLAGLDAMAAQVKAAGVTRIDGDVVIDDRLFPAYRVPNNDLLITPTMVNENMVDVTVTPTTPGRPAKVDYRPKTAALRVVSTVRTTAAGTEPTVALPEVTGPGGQPITGLVNCVGTPGCTAHVSGTIPVGYEAPLSGEPYFVGTFRVENPDNFARAAFIESLRRAGITVTAPAVAHNPVGKLPTATTYDRAQRVAALTSPPLAEQAKLVLKVSLNLGANLSLTQYGLAHHQPTRAGALAAERETLTGRLRIPGEAFDFPTNGSGSPDSRATPRSIVELLGEMSRTKVADVYKHALPVLGVDGSLAHVGRNLAAEGHVFAKTGTTITGGKLVAQTLAGYVDTRNGRRLAFAIFLNHYGPIGSIEEVTQVMTDQAAIVNALYESG